MKTLSEHTRKKKKLQTPLSKFLLARLHCLQMYTMSLVLFNVSYF